jgi:hypothetical protein
MSEVKGWEFRGVRVPAIGYRDVFCEVCGALSNHGRRCGCPVTEEGSESDE